MKSFPRALMSASVIIFSLQMIIAPVAAGQTYSAKPDASTKPAENDYSQEALVIEQMKTSYRFEKDGTGQHEVMLSVRVQSEAALQRFGQIVLPYVSANEKLEIDYLRVKKSDGTVVKATDSDVQDLTGSVSREAPIYTDVREKHLTVRGLRPGDSLEYHAIWRMATPLAPNHFWTTHNFITRDVIVLNEELEINVPAEVVAKLKTEKGFEPEIKTQDGRRIYDWRHAVLKREEVKPDDKEAMRRRREEWEDPKPPQVQLTTFKDWDEVGQWYAGLQRDRIVPDEKIKAKAQSLVQGLKTDRDKVEALYEFVAKNFRYVSLSLGQGRYQPHAAGDVMANEYGDCKDKHTLFSSMLTAAGFRGYPALINSSRKIDPDVPSPAQFDHVITFIPMGDETLWADTTAEVAPFRLLMPQLRDKKALIVPVNAPARLETTPAEPPFMSTELVEVKAEVNELGQLKGHAHVKMRGDAETAFRFTFRRTPKAQWQDLRYLLARVAGVGGGEASEIKTSDPGSLEQPFEVDFDFTNNTFLDWSTRKSKLEVPMPTLRLGAVDTDKDENSKPIQMGAPLDATYRLTLTLPAKYEAAAPLPVSIKRDYAEYNATYKLDGHILTAERTFHLRRHELEAARVMDYAAFIAATRSDEGQKIAIETNAIAGAPAIADSVTVAELMQAAEAAATNENYAVAEQLLKRVIAKEPKHKTARVDLGEALFYQRKYDEAITALREQTKINPFDETAYDLIGEAYWQQRKYAEAETAFRKQLEIAPLNATAHANLGQMLSEARRFKDAVPELEKAISLKAEADVEVLYEHLGRAHLNLGETDKAMLAFEKAVKISPKPLMWNNIAYDLALTKVQLDKAMQYAESAVSAVSTELRNAELSHLSSEDLSNVESLMAYWDTLGWVYFQKGDLATAEKYIKAAWQMEITSENAYHLGQIYERQGKKDEAIRLYAMGAVADRHVPEPEEALAKLVEKTKVLGLLSSAKDELIQLQTIKLGPVFKGAKDETNAEFYVVLMPGATGNAAPADVKFISGSEKLQTLTAALKSAQYDQSFPDRTATRIIRRGTLVCKDGQCRFVMKPPSDITSVD